MIGSTQVESRLRLDLERLRHSLLLAGPSEIELTAIPGFVFAADEMLWTLKSPERTYG